MLEKACKTQQGFNKREGKSHVFGCGMRGQIWVLILTTTRRSEAADERSVYLAMFAV